MTSGGFELSRFPDGEPDLWPIVQRSLPDEGKINSPAKELCESRRTDIIGILGHHAARNAVLFSVNPRKKVCFTGKDFLDVWGYGRTADSSAWGIQIPRFALTRRPEAGEGADFRTDIPAHLIASWMAHGLARHERRLEDPVRYSTVFESPSNPEEIREEALATDVGAYRLLHRKAIHLTPDDYISSIAQTPAYYEDLSSLLTEVDSHDRIR